MSLDPAGPQALYRQLADRLREAIRNGELAPGTRLPSEPELAEQYDVARNTVRLALGVLRAEGVIHTGRGRGTFVAADPPLRTRGSLSHSRSRREANVNDTFVTDLAEQGRTGHMDIAVETLPAPPEIADRLGVADHEEATVRRRVQYVDGRPNALADTWYPAALVAGSEIEQPDDITRGANRVLAELGHEIVRRTDDITGRMPTPVEAQQLQIAGGVPVLVVIRTGYDQQDLPSAVYVSVLPTDRHVVTYDVSTDT